MLCWFGDGDATIDGEGINWRGGCLFDSRLDGDILAKRVMGEGMYKRWKVESSG